jgi:hypothetical protein
MQYRLSTIFLVFFFVAATLALFGTWGIWIAAVLGAAALCFNKAKTATEGTFLAIGVILIGIICPGVLLPASGSAREAPRRVTCANNLKQIGLGLHNYHDARKHFPPVFISDEAGKPLFSWMVAILPHIEYDSIYTQVSHLRQSRRLPMGTAQSGSMVFTFVLMSLQHDCYDFWLFQSHCRVFTNCCLLANLPLGSKLGSTSTGIPQSIYPDLTMALN